MAGKKRKIENGPGKSKTLSAVKIPKKKRKQVQDEPDDPPTEEPPTACILLPTAPCFFKKPFNGEPPSSRKTLRIEKMAQKVFGSAGLQPSKLSVIHCNHPLVLAEFDSPFDIRRRALVESRMREVSRRDSPILWTSHPQIMAFRKTDVSFKQQEETPPSDSKPAPDNTPCPSNPEDDHTGVEFKTNEDLRGRATAILLKELPSTVNYTTFRTTLPFRCKSLELFKKSGKRNGLVSFSTPAECAEAFDALQSFEYEGSKIIASFVQPRAKPPVPKPAELAKLLPTDKQEYCLNITNIPFSTSQEQLEENFPTAEHVIMRRRKDGKSKGSCMLSFSSADDCKAVLDACRHKEIDGRRITCSMGTSEELSALIAETIARGLPKRKLDMEGCQLKLFNVPYDTSERELKKLFPQSRHIFFPEVNGSPTGIALVTFKTRAICQAALRRASHLKLKNRKIRAEINVTIKKDKTAKKGGPEGKIRGKPHKSGGQRSGTAEEERKSKDGNSNADVRLHLSPDHDENQDQFQIAWSSQPAPPTTS
ncbi:hypothetical protein SprV_0301185800 [Sparganum proliferum]